MWCQIGPKHPTDEHRVKQVQEMVLENRRLTIRDETMLSDYH